MILDECRLDEVGRHLHLNPVRIVGLGLSKEDQRRAQVLGCEDLGRELASRRLATLDGYPWSSWRVYRGSDPAMPWLRCEGFLDNDNSKYRPHDLTLLVTGGTRMIVVEQQDAMAGGLASRQAPKPREVLAELNL